MIITFVMVEKTAALLAQNAIGGDIIRTWNGLCDLQLKNHRLDVRDTYVIIRTNNSNNTFALGVTDFSSIDIR